MAETIQKLDVVWQTLRGNWDQNIIEQTLAGTGYALNHEEHTVSTPWKFQGGVLVIPGQHCISQIDDINEGLSEWPWALVIVQGDELGLFPVERLTHPNMKLWIQYPQFPRHSGADFFLPVGTPQTCKPIKAEKTMDWFFAGQRNRRDECLDVLRKLPNGELIETDGFAQGIPQDEYYAKMARARFVPCPGGAHPDTFRVWEALECGAIPIVLDDEYWRKLPAIRVTSWNVLFGMKWIFERPAENLQSDYKCLKESIVQTMKEHLCELMSRSR